MKPFAIAVIGGGASGLMAAAAAAKAAERAGIPATVTIYEANGRVGKKILVTGNGRCNLTNEAMGPGFYRGAPELFQTVYGRFDRAATLAFFEEAGLFKMNYKLLIQGEERPVTLKISPVKEGAEKRLVMGVRAWKIRK